jgi:hypothetical protein
LFSVDEEASVGVLRRHTSGFNHEASLLIGFAGHVGVADVSTLFCFAAASLRRQLASLGSSRSGNPPGFFFAALNLSDMRN